MKRKACAPLATAGASFCSRRTPQTTLVTLAAGQWPQVALARGRTPVEAQLLERPIFLGEKARVAARLMASRVPEAIVHERRSKARQNAKKKGDTPSHAHLTLRAWNLFLTHVPPTIGPTATVMMVSPLRWHIEMLSLQRRPHLTCGFSFPPLPPNIQITPPQEAKDVTGKSHARRGVRHPTV